MKFTYYIQNIHYLMENGIEVFLTENGKYTSNRETALKFNCEKTANQAITNSDERIFIST